MCSLQIYIFRLQIPLVLQPPLHLSSVVLLIVMLVVLAHQLQRLTHWVVDMLEVRLLTVYSSVLSSVSPELQGWLPQNVSV